MKYRKKPVTIEAYQTDVELDIPTLEGTMHASVGDYIITGVHGEQYPCKPDIFRETYEPAEGVSDATLGDVPRLPYFWTADGTLHVELPKLPESISVRLPDQREREVSSARVWQYTLGPLTEKVTEQAANDTDAGTCRFKTVIDKDPSRRHRGNICECDGCGYRCARGFIEDERFKYCPNCGRKVVEE